MEISRRDFARLASTAVVFRAARASAAEPNVFVAGQDLPVNLDPHQVLDVQAVVNALNAYDNLYRYEDNPPKMRPWLAEVRRAYLG